MKGVIEMKFLLIVYMNSLFELYEEFDSLKEAEEFAKRYKKYAIFELLSKHESDTEENK